MDWLRNLITEPSIAQAVIFYGLVIALGIWFGKIKLFGVSLGITWVLFIGVLASYFGVVVNKEIKDFIKEFGLILFVYSIGLQVGPGFFASLKKNALGNNLLASLVVITGIVITLLLYFLSDFHISVMTGVMSGAVTNTPGLAAAQSAAKDLHSVNTPDFMALAYAVTYPFGVFGIILTLLILKKFFRVDIQTEQELHRKLNAIRSKRLVTAHLKLENRQLIGNPLRKVFSFLKEPVVVSRIYHQGEVITPTPDLQLAEDDVMLVVASKHEMEKLKLLIGSTSEMNLKAQPKSNLISRTIVVTRKNVTHKRLGDIPELHQQDFTLTRLNRAGVEMVPHGGIMLQLADTINVVGTEEGVKIASDAIGNSLKRLEVPDLAPIFIGIVMGVILGSIPFYLPGMPVPVKIGMAAGPLIIALILSRYGNKIYLNNYTTNSANLMIRELGITLFLASVGLGSGANLSTAFADGSGWHWMWMGVIITVFPLLLVGIIAHKFFRKTYFEICGLLAGASTDPPALAFALKMAGNDIPSSTYATIYPLTMILRILGAQLLIVFLAN